MNTNKEMKMLNYKFQLEKNAKKLRCPKCQHANCYVRFINTETKDYLNYEFGRCDRQINCGYFNKPTIEKVNTNYTAPPQKIINTYSLIPSETMFKSFTDYDNNTFIDSLNKVFKIEPEAIATLIKRYRIGTSDKWNGATVFWQIDIKNKIRSGKIMLYKNGHRVKGCTNWIHSVNDIKDFTLKQCFFGEHLLNIDKSKKVAIVESEKTAIICSHFRPDFIWLASGGLLHFDKDKCKVLSYRDVVLFPDLKAIDIWNEKAKTEFPKNCKITVSQFLERIATDKARDNGFDLADYFETIGDDSYWIQQQNDNEVKEAEAPLSIAPPPIAPINAEEQANFAPPTQIEHTVRQVPSAEELDSATINASSFEYTAEYEHECILLCENDSSELMQKNENAEIKSLIEYFDSFDIPEEPLKLKPHLTITNQKEFVKKELAILKTFSGGYAYNNAYDRLTQFKQHLN